METHSSIGATIKNAITDGISDTLVLDRRTFPFDVISCQSVIFQNGVNCGDMNYYSVCRCDVQINK